MSISCGLCSHAANNQRRGATITSISRANRRRASIMFAQKKDQRRGASVTSISRGNLRRASIMSISYQLSAVFACRQKSEARSQHRQHQQWEVAKGQHHEYQLWAVFACRQNSETRRQHHQHQLRAESLASAVGTGEGPAS
eukprot:s6026_g4.t1